MTKLVVIAVLVLAAVATADGFRGEPHRDAASPLKRPPLSTVTVHPSAQPEFVAVGGALRTRVLLRGREYLTEDEIEAALPAPLGGGSFDIAHVASAVDGTVALAVHAFPAAGSAQSVIELWNHGRPLHAFTVPPGAFGGGLGFAGDGRYVATLLADGLSVVLFSRDGRRVRSIPATSW